MYQVFENDKPCNNKVFRGLGDDYSTSRFHDWDAAYNYARIWAKEFHCVDLDSMPVRLGMEIKMEFSTTTMSIKKVDEGYPQKDMLVIRAVGQMGCATSVMQDWEALILGEPSGTDEQKAEKMAHLGRVFARAAVACQDAAQVLRGGNLPDNVKF
jgi:hypothetical protein